MTNIAADFINAMNGQIDRSDRRKQQAINNDRYDQDRAIRMEDRESNNFNQNRRLDMAEDQFDFNRQQAIKNQEHAELARKDQAVDRGQQRQSRDQALKIGQMEIEDHERAKLKAEAMQDWKAAEIKGEITSPEKYELLKSKGLEKFSMQYWMDGDRIQKSLNLKGAISAIAKGDYSAINEPENISAISSVFEDEINTGNGEVKAPLGRSIVKKELADFEMVFGTGGKLAANLKITLDDGSTYKQKLTMGRSSSEEDPIRLFDPSELMDEAMSRYQIAESMSTPKQQAVLARAKQMLSGQQGASGPASATGKTIKDLRAYGVSDEDSIKLATQSKENPKAAIRDFAGKIMQNPMYEGTPAEAYAEAQSILGAAQPGGGEQDGEESDIEEGMLQKLRANPNNKKYTDDQLRQAIKQKLNTSE